MNKRIFNLFSAFLLFSSFSFAQNQAVEFDVWKLMSKKDGIEFYGKHQLCRLENAPNDYHYLNVKIINTNPTEKQISFYIQNSYQEGVIGNTEENIGSVTLKANETIEGSCARKDATLTRMILNPKFEGSWHYIKSEIIFESLK